MPTHAIRRSRSADVPLLCGIESSGDELFRGLGMEQVADSPPPPQCLVEHAHRSGRLFVAVDPDDQPVGFVRVELVDDTPHIEQVSVRRDHSGAGLGAALLKHSEEWARNLGYDRMTLTTFTEVPWNGPYYVRLGWLCLPELEWGPELVKVRERERESGLDAWPRQAMVKRL